MVKKILQDVVPPGVRSIRRIPLERDSVAKKTIRKMPEVVSRSPRVVQIGTDHTRTRETSPVLDENVVRGGSKKVNYPRIILWTLAIISILFLIVVTLLFLSRVTVEVVPKSEAVVVSNLFTAKKEPLTGELGYALMTLTKEGGETVSGTPGKKIEKRAIGNIILYNNFNAYPRKFLADTRLSAGNGKVYKLQSTVTIPGRTKAGTKFVPGSVQARVYAEKPGAEYNMLLTDLAGDFKVLAFTGDPQYETFYGRQKTDIVGGIVSTTFVLANGVEQVTRAKIRAGLKEQVLREALAQTPADFIFYQDTPLFTFESMPPVSKEVSTVDIIERVTLNGILFRKELLASAIASSTSKTLRGILTTSRGLDTLVFALKDKKDTITSTTSQFDFMLTGTTTLVAKIYPEKIVKDLVGRSVKEFGTIMGTHSEIVEVNATSKPFWLFSFPDSAQKITVLEKSPF